MVIFMKYARVNESIVVEIFSTFTGFTIDQCFTPELVAQFFPCADDVECGWVMSEDGVFTPTPPSPSSTELDSAPLNVTEIAQ